MSLSSASGSAPAAVAGALSADTMTYTALTPAQTGLSLQATVTGLRARVVLHSASDPGPFIFSVTPDAQTTLSQDAATGVITASTTITHYADDGTLMVMQPAEYILAAPVLRDSTTDPTAQGQTGPVTMTLAPPGAGAQRAITLTIDPAWLNATGRVFPVALDLPLATITAASRTGLFGTVSSCAPTVPAPLSRMVVGVARSCTYTGVASFDVSPIDPAAIVQTATLMLYTPYTTGATGVQVLPNAPTSLPAAWQPPTWTTAPAVQPGATAIAQSGGSGHWQSWDVTALVRQWVQAETSNGGLTLRSSGAPVVFSSPAWTGRDLPAVAPYLDITYTATTDPFPKLTAWMTATAQTGPTTPSITGVAGAVLPDASACGSGVPVCSASFDGSQFAVQGILAKTLAVVQPAGIGTPGRLSEVRIRKTLSCPPNGTNYANILSLITNIEADAQNTVVPIIVFSQDGDGTNNPLNAQGKTNCKDQFYGSPVPTPPGAPPAPGATRSWWYHDMADFADHLAALPQAQ